MGTERDPVLDKDEQKSSPYLRFTNFKEIVCDPVLTLSSYIVLDVLRTFHEGAVLPNMEEVCTVVEFVNRIDKCLTNLELMKNKKGKTEQMWYDMWQNNQDMMGLNRNKQSLRTVDINNFVDLEKINIWKVELIDLFLRMGKKSFKNMEYWKVVHKIMNFKNYPLVIGTNHLHEEQELTRLIQFLEPSLKIFWKVREKNLCNPNIKTNNKKH